VTTSAERLAAQRWFRAKHRPVASVAELDRAEVGPGALTVVEVAYADRGPADRYLLVEPESGDGVWSAIVRAMAEGRDLTGRVGRFAVAPTDRLSLDAPMDERRLGVEQSNTSVVIGERLILKLYRLLEPGENPDVEVTGFLAEVGFADTPALAGSMAYRAVDGSAATAAMLQAFVPSRGDAWSVMLGLLARARREAVLAAGRIGAVTAGMHAALASRPDAPGFPARAATAPETAGWRASAERQLAEAVATVRGEAHQRLVQLGPAIRARFADAFGSATGEAGVSRIHGDYHLGQLLARADGGFSVIDFEGEPARPLAERRRPSSPLRDVAGMLRSLDYAARTAERDGGPPAETWLPGARDAFLEAYDPAGTLDQLLLAAFELEKACYEVRYEAGNRPDWTWLPLEALERLVRRP